MSIVLMAACGGTAASRPSVCEGDQDLDLWAIDLDGVETRLTDAPGAEAFAAWSSDGTRLAFVSSRERNCDIYLMGRDGSYEINLTGTESDEIHPSWSPDATEVVFVRDGQLFVIDVDSSVTRQLTEDSMLHYYPDWSPDGETIAYVGGTEEPGPGAVHEVYAIPAAGGDPVALTTEGALLVGPKWSPDGTRIAYFDHSVQPFVVGVIQAGAPGPERMFPGGHISWSPDGESFVFELDDSGDVVIYLNDEVLVDSPGIDTLPAWSPDGELIVYSSDRP